MKIEVYSPTIRRKEMDAVLTAMVEDKIGPGEQTQRLIQIVKEYICFDYCLAVRSPAIALYIALQSLDLTDGQGVVISALSPLYYTHVIKALRLRPIYCDVLEGSALVSAETITEALSRKDSETAGLEARCIIVNHSLGFVPNMGPIVEMGIPVIEDCSRSYGTTIGEQPAGSFGVFTILGLEEKDMLTAGGGALLYAMNRRDASVLRNNDDLPLECQLPDMNAAMALVQFKGAARHQEKRKAAADVYIQSSLRTRHKRFLQTDDIEYNNYAFPLILETGMKDVKAYARKKEIAVEQAFAETIAATELIAPGLCPVASSLALRSALFPLYPRLSSSEIGKVAKLIATLP